MIYMDIVVVFFLSKILLDTSFYLRERIETISQEQWDLSQRERIETIAQNLCVVRFRNQPDLEKVRSQGP